LQFVLFHVWNRLPPLVVAVQKLLQRILQNFNAGGLLSVGYTVLD